MMIRTAEVFCIIHQTPTFPKFQNFGKVEPPITLMPISNFRQTSHQ